MKNEEYIAEIHISSASRFSLQMDGTPISLPPVQADSWIDLRHKRTYWASREEVESGNLAASSRILEEQSIDISLDNALLYTVKSRVPETFAHFIQQNDGKIVLDLVGNACVLITEIKPA